MGVVVITDEGGTPATPADGAALFSVTGTLKYRDESGTVHEIVTDNNAALGSGVITNTMLATDVKVGSLAALTTTEKASVVGAINEVDANADAAAAAVGTLASLTTTAKSSAVAAINEVDALIGAAASASGSIGTSIDTDGTLKAGAVDVAAVLADGVVTAAKILPGAFALQNLAWDPFNAYSVVGEKILNLARWPFTTGISIVSDANNPYGRKTLRLASGNNYVAKNYYLAETSLKIGDTITVAWQGYGADSFRLYVYFYNSSNVDQGGSFSSSNTAFGSTTKTLIASGVIPAGTYRIYVFVARTGATADFDTYFTGLFAGAFTGGVAAAGGFSDATSLAERVAWKIPAPNLLFDPFNRTTGPGAVHGVTWSGRNRFYNSAHLSIVTGDANNPFGGNTLRHATTFALAGKFIYLDEIGLQDGEFFNASIVIRSASGASTIHLVFYDAGDAVLAQTFLAPYTTHGGALTTLHLEDQTVPTGCVKIAVCSYRSSGSAAIDIYAMSFCRGKITSQVTPSVSILEWSGEIADARGAYGSLESRLDAIDGGAGFPSAADVYGLHLLRSWRAKRGIIASGGTGQAHITFIGDSWVYSASNRLRTKLQALYGNAGPGFQQFGDGNMTTYGTGGAVWHRYGTWTCVDASSGAYGPSIAHVSSVDVATPASFSVVATANTMTIHYGMQAGGGSFRYRVDAGGWTTVSTDAAAAYATEVIGSLSTASHTLEIEITVAGTGVILVGVDCVLSANGVLVDWCGNGGATAGNFAGVNATIWSDSMAALAPDTVIVLLGTNDHSGNVVPATFATHINTIVDRIQAALPLADVILLSQADNGLAGRTYAVSQYVSELRAIGVAQGAAVVDAYMNIGAYADGNSRALYANTSHLNDAGYDVMAQLVVDRLQL